MTIRAFECARSWDETPVTIFAENFDHADQIYRTYVHRHHPERPAGTTAVYLFADERLEARPHLDRASSLGVAGIGYWDVSRSVWVVRNPEQKSAGELAPPQCSVNYYLVEADEGDDARVFATSYEQATNLYCVWHTDRWGSLPHRFTIQVRSRWKLTGELATLRDGMQAGMTGVAALDEDGVMRILPPDYDPIIARE